MGYIRIIYIRINISIYWDDSGHIWNIRMYKDILEYLRIYNRIYFNIIGRVRFLRQPEVGRLANNSKKDNDKENSKIPKEFLLYIIENISVY
jgi:hypothetical protein